MADGFKYASCSNVWIFLLGWLVCSLTNIFKMLLYLEIKCTSLSTSMSHIGIKKDLASISQLDQTLLINLVTAASA